MKNKTIYTILLLLAFHLLIADENCHWGNGIAYSEQEGFKLRTIYSSGKFAINADLGYNRKEYNADSLVKGVYPGEYTGKTSRGIVRLFNGKRELNPVSYKSSLTVGLSYQLFDFEDFKLQLMGGLRCAYLKKELYLNSYSGYQKFTDNVNFIPQDYVIDRVNNQKETNTDLQFVPYCGGSINYSLFDNFTIGADFPLLGDGETVVFNAVYYW